MRGAVGDKFCPDACDECANVYVHIVQWMAYTPEFQVLIVLVSSPVALLVALWDMTFNATLHLMKSSQRDALLSLKPAKSVHWK